MPFCIFFSRKKSSGKCKDNHGSTCLNKLNFNRDFVILPALSKEQTITYIFLDNYQIFKKRVIGKMHYPIFEQR